MASGARPSSNQRSESATSAAGGGGGGRKRAVHTHDHSEKCVICGDRACLHFYYGVSACHGCKCFFWRTVKQNQQYTCRYNQNCEINPNIRNACRYCRFQRCLNAGMQPDAVRVQNTAANIKKEPGQQRVTPVKRQATSTTNGYGSMLESANGPDSSDSFRQSSDDNDQDSHTYKRARKENLEFVSWVLDLERRVNEIADFSENEAPKRALTLNEIFIYPEYLECYRTRVNYAVRLHRTTVEEMEFCKFRTLTKAFDYLNGFGPIGLGEIPIEDKIKLLRNAYAPLTIFDMICGTISATKDESILCLPTGITLSRNEEIVSNSFMSQKLVNNIVNTLTRTVDRLEPTETETCLLKAIILMSQEAQGIESSTALAVNRLRDRLHGALYQNCMHSDVESPTIRFAKLLHVLPKLTLLARELVEHIRVVHTFNYDHKAICPLFCELFGDIFEEERESSGLTKTLNSRFPAGGGKLSPPASVDMFSSSSSSGDLLTPGLTPLMNDT